jgi:hypothetical protein
MPRGPGKYDLETTIARLSTNADAAILIVLGGKLGNGFSVQGTTPFIRELPTFLRRIADEIEEDLRLGDA